MAHLSIRRLRLPHCKRGPERCPVCREGGAERICLLDLDPPDSDRVQRPVLEVREADGVTWRPYDVVRTFETEAEARRYAAAEGILDVDL